MSSALQGGDVTVAIPRGAGALTSYYRSYRLCRLFGWTPEQEEAAPALFCDWALAIDAAEIRARAGLRPG